MKRTCVYGGSFNPIHNGHIALARQMVRESLADEVWFIVSPQNPLKQDMELLSDEKRLRMVEVAIEGEEGMQVSDIEFRLPRPSYMYRTLLTLRASHPDREFSLLIGADNWQTFPRWYHYADILRSHTVFVYPRSGVSVDVSRLPSSVHLLSSPFIDISSTDIRSRLASGQRIDDIVPPEVAEMIQREGFYR